MSLRDLKTYIEKHIDLIPLNKSISSAEAEKRASEFLVAQARMADVKHMLNESKIKAVSLQTAIYSKIMNESDAKNVTEKKAEAEAHEDYITARENLEGLDNDISYVKAHSDIFENAHIFFRQLSKGDY